MKRKRLIFTEEDIVEIEKFRTQFASIEIGSKKMAETVAGGCGAQCKITCAHYCEANCETRCEITCMDGCKESCSGMCTDIFLHQAGCLWCGTLLDFFVAQQ